MRQFRTILPIVFAGLILAWGIGLHVNQISELPIVQWDESRLAINAVEMASNGNAIVTSFNNSPDLYNTKPPLMIWLQALSVKAFGINETSIRLPSILAGILCIVLLMHYTFRQSKSVWTANLAGLILICSNGFIQLHGSLTGDYDALLSLFLLLSYIHWYEWYTHQSAKDWQLYLLFMALAIMTKSSAALIMLAITVMQSSWAQLSKAKLIKNSIGILIVLMPFLAFIVLRECVEPGYLKASLFNDFIGRVQTPIDGHEGAWTYYFEQILFKRFSLFWLLFPILIIALKGRLSRLSQTLYLSSLAFLLVLSFAKTKIHWYDMPIIPMLSMAIALNFQEAINAIQSSIVRITMLSFVCIVGIFSMIQKHKAVWDKQHLDLDYTHYELSHILRQYSAKDTLLLVAPSYAPEFEFYTHQHHQIKRQSWRDLKDKDKVVLGNYAKDSIDLYYHYNIIFETNNARIIQIKP